MKRSSKIGIIVLVLLLAIGFATMTTNLLINGSGTVGYNNNNFDIYFSAADATNGSADIDRDNGSKTIDFETNTLTELNEESILDYTVRNDSYDYDGVGTITLETNPNDVNGDIDLTEYVKITMLGFEEPTTVKARSSVDGRVKIKLKKIPSQAMELKFRIKIEFEPEQREESASEVDPEDPECVSDGYYMLKCSCDNRTVAWLGGPYYDASGNPMNSTRTQELSYPPANTYKCYCGNTEGYVVNTGEVNEGGTICDAPNTPSIGEELGNTPASRYGYDITNYSVNIQQTLTNYKYSTYNWNTSYYVADGTKEVDDTIDGWKLFYYDGEYAYIMANKPINTTSIVGEEPRRIFDADQVSSIDVFDGSDSWNGSTSGNTVMISGSKLTANEYANLGTTWSSALSNPNYWTQFLDGTYGDEAYGSPTVEMWLNSFNEKYPGYNVSIETFKGDFQNGVFYGGKINNVPVTQAMEEDDLYSCDRIYNEEANWTYTDPEYYANDYDIDHNYHKVSSYILGSTDEVFRARIYGVGEGELLLDGTDTEMGLRPVVKLKANVKAIIDDEHRTITLQ